MDVEYEITATVREIYTKFGKYTYLLDDNGDEIAEVLPLAGQDFSILREGEYDIEKER